MRGSLVALWHSRFAGVYLRFHVALVGASVAVASGAVAVGVGEIRGLVALVTVGLGALGVVLLVR